MTNDNKALVKSNARILLRRHLKEHRIKQQELAKRLGYSPIYLSRAINHNFSIKLAVEIASVLDLPANYFLNQF